MANPDRNTLKFPMDACENCGITLSDKVTPHIENGFNEDHSPRLTGFCPKCGRGYAMISKVVTIPSPEPADGKLAWGDLKAKAKVEGINTHGMKREDIEAAIKAKQEAGNASA